MKNLLPDLAGWRARLSSGALALFLDYDGTLSPIAPTPSEARLPRTTREILRKLALCRDVRVVIVSGRPLADLRRMVPVRGVSFVGSHGLELPSAPGMGRECGMAYLRELRRLKAVLEKALRRSRGVIFESKPFSFAVHYREAPAGSQRTIRALVEDVCREPVGRGAVSLMHGKKMIEILPVNGMDKGRAVQKLLDAWKQEKPLAVFIGDDRTDESAFAALGSRGLTARVGRPRSTSGARYYLASVTSVRRFLAILLDFRRS